MLTHVLQSSKFIPATLYLPAVLPRLMLLGGIGTCGWCCGGLLLGLLCYFEGEPYTCSLQVLHVLNMYKQSNTEISSPVAGFALWPVVQLG